METASVSRIPYQACPLHHWHSWLWNQSKMVSITVGWRRTCFHTWQPALPVDQLPLERPGRCCPQIRTKETFKITTNAHPHGHTHNRGYTPPCLLHLELQTRLFGQMTTLIKEYCVFWNEETNKWVNDCDEVLYQFSGQSHLWAKNKEYEEKIIFLLWFLQGFQYSRILQNNIHPWHDDNVHIQSYFSY